MPESQVLHSSSLGSQYLSIWGGTVRERAKTERKGLIRAVVGAVSLKFAARAGGLEPQGRLGVVAQAQPMQWRQGSFLSLFLLRSPSDWVRTTCLTEGRLLYSKSPDLNIHHI